MAAPEKTYVRGLLDAAKLADEMCGNGYSPAHVANALRVMAAEEQRSKEARDSSSLLNSQEKA